MKPTFFKGVVLGAGTSIVVLVSATALAGTGIGAVFNLGQTNTVGQKSTLTGAVKRDAQLVVQNTGGNSALSLLVNSNAIPPLKVNSTAKVASLNADLLDGHDDFLRGHFDGYGAFTIGFKPGEGVDCAGNDLCVGRTDCDTGGVVVAGGFRDLDNGTRLRASYPLSAGQYWVVEWENDATPDSVAVWVWCFYPAP